MDHGLSYPGLGFLMGVPEFVFKLAKRIPWRESVRHSQGEIFTGHAYDKELRSRLCQDFLQSHQKKTRHKKRAVGLSKRFPEEGGEEHFHITVARETQLLATGEIYFSHNMSQ